MAKTATKLADGSAGVADDNGLAHSIRSDNVCGVLNVLWFIWFWSYVFDFEFERYECIPHDKYITPQRIHRIFYIK